jgi:sugar phosphate isomerase/epimerase
MLVTRRQLLAGAAAGASALAQQQHTANGPKPRLAPTISVHIEQFPKIGYNDLGSFLHTLGVEGCVLSLQPGGHIPPERADWELMRAVEAMTGYGVDVPAIATTATSPTDPMVQIIFAIGRLMGIPVFRPGEWKYPAAGGLQARLPQVQRDLTHFASFAGQTGMAVAIHNGAADSFGAAIWDTEMLIRMLDERVIGYDFDIGYATAHGGTESAALALRLALPRLKMVSARDCYWSKDSSGWKLTECPLGEGMVDWQGLFATLAQARFTGPVTLYVNYQPREELAAIRKDLEFLKKLVAGAYSAG